MYITISYMQLQFAFFDNKNMMQKFGTQYYRAGVSWYSGYMYEEGGALV